MVFARISPKLVQKQFVLKHLLSERLKAKPYLLVGSKQKYIDFVDWKIKRWRCPRQTGRCVVIFWKRSEIWHSFEIFEQHGFFLLQSICSGSLCVVCLWLFIVIVRFLFSLLWVALRLMSLGLCLFQNIHRSSRCWGFQQQQSWFPSKNGTGTDLAWRVQG